MADMTSESLMNLGMYTVWSEHLPVCYLTYLEITRIGLYNDVYVFSEA